MKQGDSSVREYNSSFLAAGLLDNHDQRMLVKMYRDGLKEDIRVALGSTEFSTIDDIMQAALDIEEGGRSSSSDSEKCPKKKPRTNPRKRRRRSNDHRPSKRARKADDKGDPEDEGYDYVPPPNPDESASDDSASDEDVNSSSDEDVNSSDEDVNSTSDSDA
ncbi:hypothetical protein Bca4012_063468 [Brassica carinata]